MPINRHGPLHFSQPDTVLNSKESMVFRKLIDRDEHTTRNMESTQTGRNAAIRLPRLAACQDTALKRSPPTLPREYETQ